MKSLIFSHFFYLRKKIKNKNPLHHSLFTTVAGVCVRKNRCLDINNKFVYLNNYKQLFRKWPQKLHCYFGSGEEAWGVDMDMIETSNPTVSIIGLSLLQSLAGFCYVWATGLLSSSEVNFHWLQINWNTGLVQLMANANEIWPFCVCADRLYLGIVAGSFVQLSSTDVVVTAGPVLLSWRSIF